MKKLISILTVALVAIICLASCSANANKKYFVPQLTSGNSEITIEYVTNREQSYDFLAGTLKKLDHDSFAAYSSIDHAWLLKVNNEVCGYIYIPVAGYESNRGELKYGILADDYGSSQISFNDIIIYLCFYNETGDNALDSVKLTANHGAIEKISDYEPEYRDDVEIDAVCGAFTWKLSVVDPNEVETLTIEFKLSE